MSKKSKSSDKLDANSKELSEILDILSAQSPKQCEEPEKTQPQRWACFNCGAENWTEAPSLKQIDVKCASCGKGDRIIFGLKPDPLLKDAGRRLRER